MNLFILDPCPTTSVSYYVDAHVRCMSKEYLQIICTVLHLNGAPGSSILYKPFQTTHPVVKWASYSRQNFMYLINYMECTHEEYRLRFGKDHKSESDVKIMEHIIYNFDSFTDYILTKPPLCTGSTSNTEHIYETIPLTKFDHVMDMISNNYRNYYKNYKSHLFHWTNREKPHWIGRS